MFYIHFTYKSLNVCVSGWKQHSELSDGSAPWDRDNFLPICLKNAISVSECTEDKWHVKIGPIFILMDMSQRNLSLSVHMLTSALQWIDSGPAAGLLRVVAVGKRIISQTSLMRCWATMSHQNNFNASWHWFYKSLELFWSTEHHSSKNIPSFAVLMVLVEITTFGLRPPISVHWVEIRWIWSARHMSYITSFIHIIHRWEHYHPFPSG